MVDVERFTELPAYEPMARNRRPVWQRRPDVDHGPDHRRDMAVAARDRRRTHRLQRDRRGVASLAGPAPLLAVTPHVSAAGRTAR